VPRIQEQEVLCFVLRVLSHVLTSHASETPLIRDILSSKPFRCLRMVLSIQEQEEPQGPWDSDKREDVTLVPFWREPPE
jgi:hypothetical protein